MKVKLIAHTQVSSDFRSVLDNLAFEQGVEVTDGQSVALTAIRTCYSPNEPSGIIENEAIKYFGKVASDGQGGTDADRLIRHIVNSGHTSTMEHINFTFTIEGVSRSLLAQLTRHRHFSYSVQSQRYVKFGSNDKTQGFDFVTPHTVEKNPKEHFHNDTVELYDEIMDQLQRYYDQLRSMGVPAEDVRYILPNAATCNLVLTGNLRSLLEFYGKRNPNTHAQWEIQELAELIKDEVIKVEPWTQAFFEGKIK